MTTKITSHPSILLIEDNEGDVELVRELLRELADEGGLYTVADGEEALQFLRREDPFHDSPEIDLVILDLNLPRKSGYEVLAELKGDPKTRAKPVIVLTGSSSDNDVRTAYDLGANCYLVKPAMFKELARTMDLIEQFWLRTVALPQKRGELSRSSSDSRRHEAGQT